MFDLPDQQLQQTSVSFAPGTYRYVRVTWDDRNSGRVPPPAAVWARLVSVHATPRRRWCRCSSRSDRASRSARAIT